MRVNAILFILCFVVCVTQINGLKVLLVFPIASYSHFTLGSKLMHALASKGHEATLISSILDKNIPKSCKQVYLDGLQEAFEQRTKNTQVLKESTSLRTYFKFAEATSGFMRSIFGHPEVQKLLHNETEKFDVVVVDYPMAHAFQVFAYHYNAALVVFSPIGASLFVNSITGNPQPWSYVPSPLLTYTSHMNMWQRIHNALFDFAFRIILDHFINPAMDDEIDKFFPGAPHVKELNENVSVILINSHASTNSPVPLLPNMIEIGGYHVDPPKELPEDLQKYLDNSKNGVIYFSMGSILKGSSLDENIPIALGKVFSTLNLNVLCKWDNDTLPGKPANVKLAKWLPQQDILAHPNIKLFITHGGMLSTIETVYNGVPILGLPVFGDQIMNMANAVDRGYAVQLPLDEFSEDKFSAALHEILTNPKYTQVAKQRQRQMRDRQTNPKDAAVYWIEYAARHKGEKHFRSSALDLEWYELYMVDALVFAVSLAILSSCIVFRIAKYLIFGRRKIVEKAKQS